MRLLRNALVPAATISLVLGGAPARAELAGGAVAPSAPLSGGSEYGVTSASLSHPVVTRLSVPATSAPGRPPRVILRIDEPHVGTVNVQVAIHDLTTRQPAVVVNLGWVHTGRTLTVGWPHGASLRAGTYHVSVSAHDHHSGNLKRTAHSSGVATLTVQAPVEVAPAPPVAPAPLEAGVPTPAQTVADGAVFPGGRAPQLRRPKTATARRAAATSTKARTSSRPKARPTSRRWRARSPTPAIRPAAPATTRSSTR